MTPAPTIPALCHCSPYMGWGWSSSSSYPQGPETQGPPALSSRLWRKQAPGNPSKMTQSLDRPPPFPFPFPFPFSFPFPFPTAIFGSESEESESPPPPSPPPSPSPSLPLLLPLPHYNLWVRV